MIRSLYLNTLTACSLLATAAADTSVWFDATIRFSDKTGASFDESSMVNKVQLPETLGNNREYQDDASLTLPGEGLKTSLGDTLLGVTMKVNKVNTSNGVVGTGELFHDASDTGNGSSDPYLAINNGGIMRVTFSGLQAGTYSLTGVLGGGHSDNSHTVYLATNNWVGGTSTLTSNNGNVRPDGMTATIPNAAENAKGDADTSVTWNNLTVGDDGKLTLYYNATAGGRGGFEEISIHRIPEPSAAFLGAFGAAALAFRRRRTPRISRA